jgi:hypothetical protein
MREFMESYQYNIQKEDFLKMLQHLCRQLKEMMAVDFALRQIHLINKKN